MINVGQLAPGDQWDQNMVLRLLRNELYPTGLDFRVWAGFPPAAHGGCMLIVPGRYWYRHVDRINEALASYPWVLLVRTSDEEDLFDIGKVQHPNIRFWVQTPRGDRDYGDARLFGVGFPPHFNDLPAEPPDKKIDVMLAAQNTHARRAEAFAALTGRPNSLVYPTSGFTQGLGREQYVESMLAAKIAPAPSGAVSPDSFRLWEALEAHCLPIGDLVSPVDGKTRYGERIWPEASFPAVDDDYADLPMWISDILLDWPTDANRVVAGYMRYKRQLAHWLRDDLQALGAI